MSNGREYCDYCRKEHGPLYACPEKQRVLFGMDAAMPEQIPIPGKVNILPLVIADLKRRNEVGIKKYGTTLQSHNGRDALIDAYQEALDLAMYLRQMIMERDGLNTADFKMALEAVE